MEPDENKEWDGILRPRRCFLCGKPHESTIPPCEDCRTRVAANHDRILIRFKNTIVVCDECHTPYSWESHDDEGEEGLIGAWVKECDCVLVTA